MRRPGIFVRVMNAASPVPMGSAMAMVPAARRKVLRSRDRVRWSVTKAIRTVVMAKNASSHQKKRRFEVIGCGDWFGTWCGGGGRSREGSVSPARSTIFAFCSAAKLLPAGLLLFADWQSRFFSSERKAKMFYSSFFHFSDVWSSAVSRVSHSVVSGSAPTRFTSRTALYKLRTS